MDSAANEALPASAPTNRRSYDSPARRRQMAETRERIISAACVLVRSLPTWEWHQLKVRAVAEKAGVGFRTVYRYFPSEQDLHEAVMQRLETEAGVDYGAMTLDNMSEVATKVFEALGTFSTPPNVPPLEEHSLYAADRRRRQALLDALKCEVPSWNRDQLTVAAAALDVIWSVPSYERLVVIWGFDHKQAVETISWLLRTLKTTIETDEPPPAHRASESPVSDDGHVIT